jgi:hypothetical protein
MSKRRGNERRDQTDLVTLLSEYVLASTGPDESERVLLTYPELLDPVVDVALAELIQDAEMRGDPDEIRILVGRRVLLNECRRLGVHGAIVKMRASYLVRLFVEAGDLAAKQRVLEENPRIFEAGPAVLHEMISAARAAGNADAAEALGWHLWLLTTSEYEGPASAFAGFVRR